jgi:cation:H+ antiporter
VLVWHVVVLLVCAVAIYFSCEWFVNAVEWLGARLRIGRMAVGTILAAAGTALPESVVTLVAVTTGTSPAAREVGVGAALGGPLVLSTLAYGITGAALLLRRHRQSDDTTAPVAVGVGARAAHTSPSPGESGEGAGGSGALSQGTREILPTGGDTARLARDQRWFVAVFVVKLALGLVAFALKPWLGLAFFATYVVYFAREMRRNPAEAPDEGDSAEGLAPLKLQRHRPAPAGWAVVLQTAGTLVVIFIASQAFVTQIEAIGPMLGLSAAVTALLLSPIATELPEIANAIIWIRQGKTPLALANISGAMMIQATIPSGLGLVFTDWRFGPALTLAGIITLAAIGYLLFCLRTHRLTPTRLAGAGGFYGAFAAGLALILT